jgi:putative chitinase
VSGRVTLLARLRKAAVALAAPLALAVAGLGAAAVVERGRSVAIRPLAHAGAPINAVAMSADGRFAAIASANGALTLLRADRPGEPPRALGNGDGPVTSLVIVSEGDAGQRLVYATALGQLRRRDAQTGEMIVQPQAPFSTTPGVLGFDPSENVLIYAGDNASDPFIVRFDLASFAAVRLPLPTFVAASTDGEPGADLPLVAIRAERWQVQSLGQERGAVFRFFFDNGAVKSEHIGLLRDGAWVLIENVAIPPFADNCADSPNDVTRAAARVGARFYDIRANGALCIASEEPTDRARIQLSGPLASAAIDGNRAVLGETNGHVRIVDLPTRRILARYRIGAGAVTQIAIAGDRALVGTADGAAAVIHLSPVAAAPFGAAPAHLAFAGERLARWWTATLDSIAPKPAPEAPSPAPAPAPGETPAGPAVTGADIAAVFGTASTPTQRDKFANVVSASLATTEVNTPRRIAYAMALLGAYRRGISVAEFRGRGREVIAMRMLWIGPENRRVTAALLAAADADDPAAAFNADAERIGMVFDRTRFLALLEQTKQLWPDSRTPLQFAAMPPDDAVTADDLDKAATGRWGTGDDAAWAQTLNEELGAGGANTPMRIAYFVSWLNTRTGDLIGPAQSAPARTALRAMLEAWRKAGLFSLADRDDSTVARRVLTGGSITSAFGGMRGDDFQLDLAQTKFRWPADRVLRFARPPATQAAPDVRGASDQFIVFFEWDRSRLMAEALAVIDESLKRNPPDQLTRVVVVGHTDSSRSAEYSQQLSARMAASVAEAMVSRGVPPERIEQYGLGKSNLLVATQDGVREPQNRRVEVSLFVGRQQQLAASQGVDISRLDADDQRIAAAIVGRSAGVDEQDSDLFYLLLGIGKEFGARTRSISPRLPDYLPAIWAARNELRTIGVSNELRLAHFVAQGFFETRQFSARVENMNFSADELRSIWGSRFPDETTLVSYVGQPERIANYVYANRMGNRDEASGDGWRYRGRGFFQIAGRDAYIRYGDVAGVDLVNDPEALERDLRLSVTVAARVFMSMKLSQFADSNDAMKVSRGVNLGNPNASRQARNEAERVATTARFLKYMEQSQRLQPAR